MTETETLDILRTLIVGSRGRERATRLLCYDDAGDQTVVEVKENKRPLSYVPLVASTSPVRIEAYAGKSLVGAWGERPRTARRKGSTGGKSKGKEKPGAVPKTARTLTAHFTSLLAGAYKEHSAQLANAHKVNAERDTKIFESLRQIAQHHADRAAHAEQRAADRELGIRKRDRHILELQRELQRLHGKVAEVAAASDGDGRTTAFLNLLQTIQSKPAAPDAHANGAAPTKKKKEKPS